MMIFCKFGDEECRPEAKKNVDYNIFNPLSYLQPLDFGKIYNITLKLAKSTSKIKLFITNLQANHHQILAKSTIYKKGKPPIDICKISEHKNNF